MAIITAIDRCLARMMGQDNTILHGFARCVLVIVLVGSTVIASLWLYQWVTTERTWEPARPAAVVTETQPGADLSGAADELVEFLTEVFIMLATFGVYFLPALIAAIGKKKQANAICVLNLLLGWTGLGWAVAMVWACAKD